MTSASDDKACVSKFNQVENDLQNYINAQLIILQDSAYDAGYEAGQAAALRSPAPAATVTGEKECECCEYRHGISSHFFHVCCGLCKHPIVNPKGEKLYVGFESVDAWQEGRRLTPPAQGTFAQRLSEWADKTFPESTYLSVVTHLKKEVQELLDAGTAEEAREEAADVFMMLTYLANKAGFDLQAEAEKKFAVVKEREWGKPDADGVVEHVRAVAAVRGAGG